MSLDKTVFIQGMNQLLMVFPSWQIKYDDKKVMSAWYRMFEDLTDDQFRHMTWSYIKSEKFVPTVAGLMEHDTLPRKSQTQIAHERMLKEQKELLELERLSKC